VAGVLAAALLLGACSDREDPDDTAPTSAVTADDRDTVYGFRMPAEPQGEIARKAPAPPLDPRLPVNQAYAAETPRDPSVHRVDEAMPVATPMPFAHEALHSGNGSSPAR
jgi:type IV secretory pathway VirB10-like protein